MILLSYTRKCRILSHHFIIEKYLTQSEVEIGDLYTKFIFENKKIYNYWYGTKLSFECLNEPYHILVKSIHHFNILINQK